MCFAWLRPRARGPVDCARPRRGRGAADGRRRAVRTRDHAEAPPGSPREGRGGAARPPAREQVRRGEGAARRPLHHERRRRPQQDPDPLPRAARRREHRAAHVGGQGRQRRPVALPARDPESEAHRRRRQEESIHGHGLHVRGPAPREPRGAHVCLHGGRGDRRAGLLGDRVGTRERARGGGHRLPQAPVVDPQGQLRRWSSGSTTTSRAGWRRSRRFASRSTWRARRGGPTSSRCRTSRTEPRPSWSWSAAPSTAA